MLRAIRRRIGVRSAKVSVRPEMPLHWRVLSVLLLSAVALALAGWIYDAGRRFAGFDKSQSGEQLLELQGEVTRLRQELAEVTSIADSSVAKLQMEKTVQEQLTVAVKSLEEENAKLKSELAVFESLAGNDPRVFQYRLLATKSGSAGERNFTGRLELVLSVRTGERLDIVSQSGKDGSLSYPIQFRFFKRVDGKFALPGQGVLEAVEAKLIEGGQTRATQLFNVTKK